MLVSPRVQTFSSPILDHWFQFLPATMEHERESCAKPGATRAFRKLLLPHRGAILRMNVRTLPHTTIRPGTLRVGRERKSTHSQIQGSSTTHAHHTISPARPNPPPERIPPATSGSLTTALCQLAVFVPMAASQWWNSIASWIYGSFAIFMPLFGLLAWCVGGRCIPPPTICPPHPSQRTN